MLTRFLHNIRLSNHIFPTISVSHTFLLQKDIVSLNKICKTNFDAYNTFESLHFKVQLSLFSFILLFSLITLFHEK